MPIIVSNDLPAFSTLEQEGVPIINPERAEHQDIRPLNIGILNLMPTATKEETEIQFLRLLSNTPLQINPILIYFDKHKSESFQEHLDKFYVKFSEIQKIGLDGLIITGGNLEHFDFEEVVFWDELKNIIAWADKYVTSTIYACWASHAGLYLHYNIKREFLGKKLFGVFPHNVYREHQSLLTKNMDDLVQIPYARWNGIPRTDIEKIDDVHILIESEEAGIHLLSSKNGRRIFVQGHPEYDRETIQREYERDVQKGDDVSFPQNYFPDDDPTKEPVRTWVSNGQTFYSNWINFVYQTTHFDLLKPVMDE